MRGIESVREREGQRETERDRESKRDTQRKREREKERKICRYILRLYFPDFALSVESSPWPSSSVDWLSVESVSPLLEV